MENSMISNKSETWLVVIFTLILSATLALPMHFIDHPNKNIKKGGAAGDPEKFLSLSIEK